MQINIAFQTKENTSVKSVLFFDHPWLELILHGSKTERVTFSGASLWRAFFVVGGQDDED